ncbi:MAG: hypothetical protein VX694_09575 [Planctomycetota bacterium]|nr:hypothetical protein [Planctomycetota bacterium]
MNQKQGDGTNIDRILEEQSSGVTECVGQAIDGGGETPARSDKPKAINRSQRSFPISVPGLEVGEAGIQEVISYDDEQAKHDDSTAKFSSDTIPSIPFHEIIVWGLAGAILFCASLMVLGLGQFAFLVIAPWAWLCLDARRLPLTGGLILWVIGSAMWLVLRFSQSIEWTPMAEADYVSILYLGIYLPAFIYLGRCARSLLHLPSYLSLPVIWGGLEYARCQIFGGFSLGLLAHAAAESRRVIQMVDLFGSYGLSMFMAASGASLAELIWMSRRLRRLELAKSEQAKDTALIRQSPVMRSHADRKSISQKSMYSLLRRKRDRARDVHLVYSLFSVAVIVAIIVFSNTYGQRRASETKAWKMFESHLYEVATFSGASDSRLFEVLAAKPSQSLLMGFFSQPYGDLPQKRPILMVDRSSSSGGDWRLTSVSRNAKKSQYVMDQGKFSRLVKLVGADHRDPLRLMGKEIGIPLKMLFLADSSCDVEDSVNTALSSEYDHGSWVDLSVVVIESGQMDGTVWPSLFLRSILTASIANRCAVICAVPEKVVVISNGDGGLWWSSAVNPKKANGNPRAEGQTRPHPLRVHALMDPRSSLFVGQFQHYPALLACCSLIALGVASCFRQFKRLVYRG